MNQTNADAVRFSVIVPVYKTDLSLLNRCLDSVIQADTQKQCEILVVCNSMKDPYPWNEIRKDSRIRVIYNLAKGVSCGRNTGLDYASGDYILFVDSDDQVSENMISAIRKTLKQKNHPDILIYGFEKRNKDKGETVLPQYTDNPEQMLLTGNGGGLIWNKAFKASYLADRHFRFRPNLKRAEDVVFLSQMIASRPAMAVLAEPLYIYNIYDQSVSQKYNPDIVQSYLDSMTEIEMNPDLSDQTKNDIIVQHMVYSVLKGACSPQEGFGSFKQGVSQIVQNPVYQRVLKDSSLFPFNKFSAAAWLIKNKMLYPVWWMKKLR